MKQTKEQMIAELIKLKQSNEIWSEENKRRKEEFAKIFGWFKPHGRYGEEELPITPSWEEIFTEVGKLLAARNFYDFEGNLSELEQKIRNLEEQLLKNGDSNKR